MKVYRYSHRQAIIVTCIVILLSLVIALFRGLSLEKVEGELIDAVMVGAIAYIFCYGYLLNKSFVVERDRLVIKKWIGRDRSVDFAEVRRFALREEGGLYGFDGLELTLYTNDGKIVVQLDSLCDQDEFIRLVERRIRNIHEMESLDLRDLPDARRADPPGRPKVRRAFGPTDASGS